MQIKDFFWYYFRETGGIGAYLIYKKILEEESIPLKVVSEEE